jgi:hypothetical protein
MYSHLYIFDQQHIRAEVTLKNRANANYRLLATML